jgi:hypothetical protein
LWERLIFDGTKLVNCAKTKQKKLSTQSEQPIQLIDYQSFRAVDKFSTLLKKFCGKTKYLSANS